MCAAKVLLRILILLGFVRASPLLYGQTLTIDEAIRVAQANNRELTIAELDRKKALEEFRISQTYRLPIFSIAAFGSQSLSHLGLTFERGALGTYPNVGPIPGTTTVLQSPLRPAGIFFGSVAEPLSQQYKIGLQAQRARLSVAVNDQQVRAKRQAIVNEVRRLYYGILQAESGKKSLQATVEFLRELQRDTRQKELQRVALHADALNVEAQLAEAEYQLLKVEKPLQAQKQQLNRLMGRDVNTPFDPSPLSAADFEIPDLRESCARALESRPEVRLAQLKARETNLSRRIANAERIPDISLSANAISAVNLSDILPTQYVGLGIQVNWDVFDWGRKRKRVEEARFGEDQASLALEDTKALIVIEVSDKYRRFLEARKEVEVAAKFQAAGQELFRVTKNQFAQKEALLGDLLKAQSGLVESNHRFTQALLDLATAQADFQKAVGADQ